MQAGVSNQVARVLGIYERKRAGLLLEIDEKPELSNKKRKSQNFYKVYNVTSVLYFLLTSLLRNPYADTNNFYIVKAKKCKAWATLNSFGRFFFVLASVHCSSFQIWRSEYA